MSPTQNSQSPFKVSSVGVLKKGISSKATLKVKGSQKKKVIPVIFIPGIFASRLETMDGDKIWDPEDINFLANRLANSSNVASMALKAGTDGNMKWTDKQIDTKINLLKSPGQPMNLPGTTIRDTEEKKNKIIEILKSSTVFEEILDRNKLSKMAPKPKQYNNWNEELNKQQKHAKKINKFAEELYNTRRERGWYTILGEYFKIMEKINSHEVESDDFYFPTYGFGYDWRDDITKSAAKFAARINEVKAITDYPEYGTLSKNYEIELSKKVIIVTHSMGSIVTRFASEHCGARDSIHSVLHLNQPTTGAPILYRRFLVGTEAEKKSVFWNIMSFKAVLAGNVFNEILGTTSYHFAKLVASMPGPLELLPTNQHRLDFSLLKDANDTIHKNDWLNPNHNFLKPVKANNTLDVYTDVYMNDRIGLLACKRYDEHGKPKPYTKDEFTKVILYDKVTSKTHVKFKSDLTKEDRGKYTITSTFTPESTPYSEDNYRLVNKSSNDRESRKSNKNYKKNVTKAIQAAKTFHDKLQLDKHPKTTVAGSTEVETVVKIDLNLQKYNDKYKHTSLQNMNNQDSILDLPYDTSDDGDGTVPLTSQLVLLSPSDKPAKPAGKIVTGNNAGHADIPKNEMSLTQVIDYLDRITNELTAQNVNTQT